MKFGHMARKYDLKRENSMLSEKMPKLRALLDLVILLPEKADDWTPEQLTEHFDELKRNAIKTKEEAEALLNDLD